MPAPAVLAAIGSAVTTVAKDATGPGVMAPAHRGTGYLANAAFPNVLPSPDELLAAWQNGTLNSIDAARFLRSQGVVGTTTMLGGAGNEAGPFREYAYAWQKVMDSKLVVPSTGDILQLLNRRTITKDTATRWMRRSGVGEADVRDAIESLRYQLPGPSDLISFALKEAWDAQVVQAYGYDAEFPPEFAEWMARQGANGDARTDAQKQAGAALVTWAQMYWRVHWQNLSPSQCYELFQRLRPGRVQRLQGVFPGLRPFTLDDLRAQLKINDYPGPYRDWLAAVAFRSPRLIDVEKYYELGLADDRELVELHLDLGYSPPDAAKRAQYVKLSVNRRLSTKARGAARAGLMDAYRTGVLSREDAATALYQLVYVGTPQLAAWMQLAPVQQRQQVLADPQVSAALDDQDRAVQLAYAKRVIAVTKKRYLTGMWDAASARKQLQAAGIQPARIGNYLFEWELTLSGPRLYLSTSRIQRLVKEQVMPLASAQLYLSNLGWRGVELQYVLGEAARSLSLEVARAQEKAAATIRQQQKAQQAQLKELAAEQRRVLAELTRQASVASLAKWYVRGIIDRGRLVSSLQARGLAADVVAATAASADVDRQDYLQKRADAAAKKEADRVKQQQQQQQPAAVGQTAPPAAP